MKIYMERGWAFDDVYPAFVLEKLPSGVEIVSDRSEAEVLLTSWGCPKLDESTLEALPALRLVLYGAGSIRGLVSDAAWDRQIRFCSAWGANAIPVCEYTVSTILLSLKQFWRLSREVREKRTFKLEKRSAGAFGSTIGVVSVGMIGRLVIESLQAHDVKVVAFDPIVPAEQIRQLGATPVSLEELFLASDVVSIHTPWLKETEGMVGESLMRSMKPNATLINTSRGALINEPALCRVLEQRKDLTAVLDVTYPEPPGQESPLYALPNVVLTPHIAGAIGPECARLGMKMVEELENYVLGRPLLTEITRERASILA